MAVIKIMAFLITYEPENLLLYNTYTIPAKTLKGTLRPLGRPQDRTGSQEKPVFCQFCGLLPASTWGVGSYQFTGVVSGAAHPSFLIDVTILR